MEDTDAGINARRTFLEWLAMRCAFKEAKALELIRFFLSSPERLARLRVVQESGLHRPLLLVAAIGQRQPGLLYQTWSGSSRDDSLIRLEISLDTGPVYLVPYFPRRSQSRLFQRAKEAELPVPAATPPGDPPSENNTTRPDLNFLIDQALERQDRAAFRSLVKELKKIAPDEEDLATAGRKKS